MSENEKKTSALRQETNSRLHAVEESFSRVTKTREVTYKPELVDKKIILSVRDLKQFFDLGEGEKTKAVHDVSFDIHEKECFGLVGESGCGKTTTGRSIIRLYHVTSGSVYYKGYRINCGSRWNEKEIKWSKIHAQEKIKALKAQEKKEIASIPLKSRDFVTELADLERAEAEEIKEKNDPFNENNDEAMAAVKARYQKKREELEILRDASSLSEKEQEDKINGYYEKEILAAKDAERKHISEQQEAIAQIHYDDRAAPRLRVSDENKGLLGQKESHRLVNEIQMIFQDPVYSLDPRMTVEDIIQEGLHIQHQYNSAENHKKCIAMLEKVGLIEDYASRYPHEFSGGQRQRIGIARALIMNPKLLICDEPILALDVSIRAQIINLLNDLKKEMGLTMIFIAHDLSTVKYFCDRIAVMYFGELVELTTSDELFKHPLHPYTKSLLSAIPKPNPLSEKNRIRKIYNPATAHDYSKQKPTFRESLPGHWILCNDAEEVKYREEIKSLDIANAAKAKENDNISAVLDRERAKKPQPKSSVVTKKKGQ